jgi:hypothetical protein
MYYQRENYVDRNQRKKIILTKKCVGVNKRKIISKIILKKKKENSVDLILIKYQY